MTNFENLTDRELYLKCKMFGLDVIKARRKFTGLLPEVMAREIKARIKGKSWFKKRGFYDIYDFSARLAGLSHDQVDEILRLERRFIDKPILREALIKGKVSVPKLARVASIVTAENQNEILEKVRTLSKAAIDVFVKDYKNEHGFLTKKEGIFHGSVNMFLGKNEDVNGLKETKNWYGSLSVQNEIGKGNESLYGWNMKKDEREGLPIRNEIEAGNENLDGWNEKKDEREGLPIRNELKTEIETERENEIENDARKESKPTIRFGEKALKLDEDVNSQLLELQNMGIDINSLLRKFLKQREEKIEQKIEEISKEVTSEEKEKTCVGIPIGRYKKAKIKLVVAEKFGTRCAVLGCGKLAEQVHHEKHFSKYRTHDPKFLKPLCRGHHELAHVGEAKHVGFK